MRQRFIQDPQTGELVPAAEYFAERSRTHFVLADLPDYESPIDGRVVHGRAGRREDLRRNGCRPWEGRAAEQAEASRQRAYSEAAADRRLDASVRTAWAQLPPEKRAALLRG